MRLKAIITALLAVAALVLSACNAGSGNSGSAEDYPSQELDWTIAFGPGGGNDMMARKLVQIIQEKNLYPNDIAVENREGGSGATGWGYLLSKRGSGYDVSTTSGSFLTTPLQADPGWTYKDFTHVGLMATDDALLLVDGKKGIRTFEDWVAYAKNKGKVVVGGIGTVNVDFILQSLIAEHAGYEIEYVPYNEEGQVQTSLLSGALDSMISNPGSILGQVESGDMTPVLFTGKERLQKLPDVPTGAEKGMADLPSMPRGFILPPDAPDYARDWWIKTMKEVVQTEEWQAYLADNYLTKNELWGDDFTAYLETTTAEFEKTLKEQGAL
ncbi:Bug family tripartite tricarboxylate transporter substrate binding protein [Mycolicibacterium arseniciresistens]|uniref:Tripartite tricarboxylate transporter substrate-binding protein n=1 Tax=Mycolicibacterium arseniciresistens TaxID=3062257 RepID=A0ABT8UG61_9MYCO|nr:tripartite tricarboxylate transporter substrate-binding protein [Mycolicibacterium arseniciresistens]MDO3636753.1 tripartite tricarboxylate transporter substrate-binding protein [Mycolicibacterium arseniciresistens]